MLSVNRHWPVKVERVEGQIVVTTWSLSPISRENFVQRFKNGEC